VGEGVEKEGEEESILPPLKLKASCKQARKPTEGKPPTKWEKERKKKVRKKENNKPFSSNSFVSFCLYRKAFRS
jgi:hypothetical protein